MEEKFDQTFSDDDSEKSGPEDQIEDEIGQKKSKKAKSNRKAAGRGKAKPKKSQDDGDSDSDNSALAVDVTASGKNIHDSNKRSAKLLGKRKSA